MDISPKSFLAANKQTFSVIGKGGMVINIPDGADISQLRLTDVLYSPEVGYALISIGKLDEKGFSSTLLGGKCVIQGPDGQHIGEVLRNRKGLYRVEHEGEKANPIVETLTLDQLHRQMGHISPLNAQKLIDNGFLMGVR